jgi:hypothetical protein
MDMIVIVKVMGGRRQVERGVGVRESEREREKDIRAPSRPARGKSSALHEQVL